MSWGDETYSRAWPGLSERLPVDVLPCSNEEYFPPVPSAEQLAIMELANRETERMRRRFGMSRRDFVRTSAAMAIGFYAIDMIMPGRYGNYGWADNTDTTKACDLEWDGKRGAERLTNLPGEFIFDVQTHHVEPDGMWRVTNPAIHAFFAAVWPQASPITGGKFKIRPDGSLRGGGAGEIDPIENLSRFHYLKEIFLDSATSMSVLSCVPTSPDSNNPLPLAEAALTVDTVNELSRGKRTVMHAFVMPNHGSPAGDNVPYLPPPNLDAELELMMERARKYRHILRGWKTYCAWGSVPFASGWWLDSDTGMAVLDQIEKISRKFPEIPPVIATHKGFALPGFDQEKSSPRDVGPAARQFPKVRFLIYHSGFDIGDTQRPYRGDARARSNTNTVDSLIKSLRENNWDASRFRKKGKRFGNVPNVYAELGSVWRSVMDDPDQAAHLLGKLITHVGPKRIVWGTDSLWYGSPQAEIVALRRFDFTPEGREMYGLPYGLEGDVRDPTRKAPHPKYSIRNGILGRNAARAYNIKPRKKREIDCDKIEQFRNSGYVANAGTERESAPMASHLSPGPRTRRELVKRMSEGQWAP